MLTMPEKTAASARHVADSLGTADGEPRRDATGRWVDLRQFVMPAQDANDTAKPIFDDSTKEAIEAALEAAFAKASQDNIRFDQPVRSQAVEPDETAIDQKSTACDHQILVSATTVSDETSFATLEQEFDELPPAPPSSFAPVPEGAAVERRDSGTISKVRFTNGSTAQYRYNDRGDLCAFIYARLAWCTDDGLSWTARDKDNEYCLQGRVSVEPDGTLCIQKKEIVRRIMLDGTRYDMHPDGSAQTSKPAQREASPGDLLVLWRRLSPTPMGKRSGPQTVAPAPPVRTLPVLPVNAPAPQQVFQPKSTYVPPAPRALPKANPAMSIDVGNATHSQEEQKTTVKAHLTVRPQRLRQIDDYVKPEDASVKSWFKTSLENWYANASVDWISRFCGAEDVRLIPHFDTLARLSHENRVIDDAQKYHELALGLREHYYGRTHETCAVNLQGLAKIHYEQARYAEAAKLYLEAINLREKNIRKLSFFNNSGLMNERVREDAITSLLHVINQLAQMYAEQGKYSEAEQQFRRALDAWNALPVATSDELCAVMQTVLRNYKELLVRSNKHVEAEALDAQTEILMSETPVSR